MILKFLGDSDNSKVCTICARWAVCSFSSSGKRKEKTSPDKDYMFGTLTQLERDLVNFVSKVHNLKLATVTGDNRKCSNLEVPADAYNNIICMGQGRPGLSGFVC